LATNFKLSAEGSKIQFYTKNSQYFQHSGPAGGGGAVDKPILAEIVAILAIFIKGFLNIELR
jgi:hypothetical protein